MNTPAYDPPWTKQKIWTCFEIVNGATPTSGVARFWDGDIAWVGPADLGKLKSPTIFCGERNLTLAGYKSCGTSLVPEKSIILSSRAPIGHVAIAGRELCFNQGCKGLVAKPLIDEHFSYWLVKSLTKRLEAAGQGTTFVELSRSKLKDVEFLLPPFSEQCAIAAFLDRQCIKIDEAVQIKEEQIALLRERRQILIQQAVTRGLNPNAPMKDSGIDWIGQIPAHWTMQPNKFLFSLKKTLVGKRAPDYDLLSLTLRGIIKRDIENPEGKFPAEFDTYQEVTPGDFVFCHFDVEETPRTVGLSEHAGMITGAYTVYEPIKTANARFLMHFYLFADTDKKMRGMYKGLRNTIPKDAFAAFKTPLPPRKEQDAIVDYIDSNNQKISSATMIKEKQISRLKEYKTSLIDAAVTGKIRVI